MPAPRKKPETAPAATEPKPETNGKAKTCVITRQQFREKAPAAIEVKDVLPVKKEFETGTLGYFTQVSAVVHIDGVPVKMNGMCQLFIPNSKEAK